MENGVKNVHGLDRLLSDFFSQDDLGRLAADAGEILNCPLLVIDDTFHVVAHYTTPGFSDTLFEKAIQLGEITYEAGAIISRSPALSTGQPDFIKLADSTHRRRFAPLVSAGVRLGYLICIDVDQHLQEIDAATYRTVETVLSKQLFVQVGRQDKPFETAEEILMHLLDGGFPSASYFRLQASSTYLADFHPTAFALIDLTAFHTLYLEKSQWKDVTYLKEDMWITFELKKQPNRDRHAAINAKCLSSTSDDYNICRNYLGRYDKIYGTVNGKRFSESILSVVVERFFKKSEGRQLVLSDLYQKKSLDPREWELLLSNMTTEERDSFTFNTDVIEPSAVLRVTLYKYLCPVVS